MKFPVFSLQNREFGGAWFEQNCFQSKLVCSFGTGLRAARSAPTFKRHRTDDGGLSATELAEILKYPAVSSRRAPKAYFEVAVAARVMAFETILLRP